MSEIDGQLFLQFVHELGRSQGQFEDGKRVLTCLGGRALREKAQTPGHKFGRDPDLRSPVASEDHPGKVREECRLGQRVGKAVGKLPGVAVGRTIASFAGTVDDGHVATEL